MQKIQSYPGFRQVFVATEEVSHLCAIAIAYSADGVNRVDLGEEATQAKAGGIAYGARSGAISGQLIRVVTQGIVSGVILGADCLVGDRLMLASAGRLMPLNTITPIGAVSGRIIINLVSGGPGGGLTVQASDTALGYSSGLVSGITGALFTSGAFAGTAFDTARVLGKALSSGLAGKGIPVLVTLGG